MTNAGSSVEVVCNFRYNILDSYHELYVEHCRYSQLDWPMTAEHYYVLAIAMFTCGVVGLLVRKNIIIVLMAIELMLNAVNLVFVAASQQHGSLDGQVVVFFVITIAACEATVGLAMVIALFRKFGTIDTDFYRLLRG